MNKSYFKKGFTLIELLVVVGILAVLAIAALIAINPIEAQRRSRDSARLQDMARLTAAWEAFLNDTGTPFAADTSLDSSSVAAPNLGVRSQTCGATSWMGIDLCPYLKQVPLDPQNGRNVTALSAPTGARATVVAEYHFGYDGTAGATQGDYKFCTRLEADANASTLNDGDADGWFETGANTAIAEGAC